MMSDLELRAALMETIRESNVCGATEAGQRVFCDDSRLPDEIRHRCNCGADADAILATLRASSRLAPAVEGDVIEAALDHTWRCPEYSEDYRDEVRAIIEKAAPIIAADTEMWVREECALAARDLAEIIRTGATR